MVWVCVCDIELDFCSICLVIILKAWSSVVKPRMDTRAAFAAATNFTGARNRRSGMLSAMHAHTKAPCKMDLHRKTRMALNRP